MARHTLDNDPIWISADERLEYIALAASDDAWEGDVGRDCRKVCRRIVSQISAEGGYVTAHNSKNLQRFASTAVLIRQRAKQNPPATPETEETDPMPTPKPTAGDMFIGWGLLMQKLEVTATHLEKILLLPSFPKPVVDGVKTRSKKWSAREVDTWKAEYPHLIQEAAKTRPRSTRALVLAEWRIEIEERLAEIEKILKGMA